MTSSALGSCAEDATSRYVDAATRVGTLQAAHTQLLALMERAVEVRDVLAVQQQLTHTTATLEAQEAQRRRIAGQAVLSSLSLDLEEPEPARRDDGDDVPPRPWWRRWRAALTVRAALRVWVAAARAVADGVIFVTILGGPVGLAALLCARSARLDLSSLWLRRVVICVRV